LDKRNPAFRHRVREGTGLAENRTPRKHRHAGRGHGVDQSALAGIVGYRLRLAQVLVFEDFRKAFADLAIRPVDYSILRIVETNPGMRQGELARALGIKRANMVSLIHGLEERGLVERRRVDSDKRAQSLHLTRLGKSFVREMQRVWRTHEDRMVARLGGEQERAALVALLDKLAPLH
jgi:DNA-binding MarR family transcriptional regulator